MALKVTYRIVEPITQHEWTRGEWEIDELGPLTRIDIATEAGITVVCEFDPPIIVRPAGLKRATQAVTEIILKAAVESLEEGEPELE